MRRNLPVAATRDGVEFERVARAADAYPALERIELRLAPGTVTAFTGGPGSGVDTLVGLLATRLAPTSGSLRLAGHDTVTATARARAALGHVPAIPSAWGGMRPAEVLRTMAAAHGLTGLPARRRADELLDAARLPGARGPDCAHLDAPALRRLGLATALVHGPRILVLDGPFVGLPADERDDLAASLRRLAGRGLTVALGVGVASGGPGGPGGLGGSDSAAAAGRRGGSSTARGLQDGTGAGEVDDPEVSGDSDSDSEDIADIEGVADRIVVLAHGRLRSSHDVRDIALRRRWRLLSDDPGALRRALDRLGVDQRWPQDEPGAAPEMPYAEVLLAQDRDAADLLAALVAAGVPVHGLVPPPTRTAGGGGSVSSGGSVGSGGSAGVGGSAGSSSGVTAAGLPWRGGAR